MEEFIRKIYGGREPEGDTRYKNFMRTLAKGLKFKITKRHKIDLIKSNQIEYINEERKRHEYRVNYYFEEVRKNAWDNCYGEIGDKIIDYLKYEKEIEDKIIETYYKGLVKPGYNADLKVTSYLSITIEINGENLKLIHKDMLMNYDQYMDGIYEIKLPNGVRAYVEDLRKIYPIDKFIIMHELKSVYKDLYYIEEAIKIGRETGGLLNYNEYEIKDGKLKQIGYEKKIYKEGTYEWFKEREYDKYNKLFILEQITSDEIDNIINEDWKIFKRQWDEEYGVNRRNHGKSGVHYSPSKPKKSKYMQYVEEQLTILGPKIRSGHLTHDEAMEIILDKWEKVKFRKCFKESNK